MQGILVRHFARSAMTMFGRTRRPQLIAFGTWTAIGFALSLSAITITSFGLYGFPLSLIALVLAIRHVRVWPEVIAFTDGVAASLVLISLSNYRLPLCS